MRMGVEVVAEPFSLVRSMGGRRVISTHATRPEAVAAAKSRVDAALLGLWHHGMSAKELYSRWTRLAENVVLVPDTGHPAFSAHVHARMRVQDLTGELCV